MNTNYIGIDFSINSPGITILQAETQIYHWIYISRKPATGFNTIKTTLANVSCLTQVELSNLRTSRSTKTISYVEREEETVKDTAIYCQQIIDLIKANLNSPDLPAMIGIEGLSYSSQSSTFADIAAYHGHLRASLYNQFAKGSRIITWSPKSIKNFAGAGGFKKWDMVNAFLTHSNPLVDLLNQHRSILSKQKPEHTEWSAPIYDLVDSWWILEKTRNYFL